LRQLRLFRSFQSELAERDGRKMEPPIIAAIYEARSWVVGSEQ
jgi:hypothetical protein